MTGPTPSQALLRRHHAAMELIQHVAPEERIGLLVAVVAPSREMRELLARAEQDPSLLRRRVLSPA